MSETESVAVMSYGASGLGKTTDQVAAFPNAHYITQPRAVMVSKSVWGFDIPANRIDTVKSLQEAIAVAKKASAAGLDLVIDDLSPLVEYTVREYEGKYKGYDVYKAATHDVLEIRRIAEFSKRMFACSAHLGQPHTNALNGRFIRGGPRLPGQMPELIVTAFDTIVQIESDPARTVNYPFSYICRPTDATMVAKDRHSIADRLGVMPPNFRELLVAAGYKLQRPKGLEWMDVAVENIAGLLLSRIAEGQITAEALYSNKLMLAPVATQIRTALDSKYTKNEKHQYWVMRDSVDRALIRVMLKNRGVGPLSPFGG